MEFIIIGILAFLFILTAAIFYWYQKILYIINQSFNVLFILAWVFIVTGFFWAFPYEKVSDFSLDTVGIKGAFIAADDNVPVEQVNLLIGNFNEILKNSLDEKVDFFSFDDDGENVDILTLDEVKEAESTFFFDTFYSRLMLLISYFIRAGAIVLGVALVIISIAGRLSSSTHVENYKLNIEIRDLEKRVLQLEESLGESIA